MDGGLLRATGKLWWVKSESLGWLNIMSSDWQVDSFSTDAKLARTKEGQKLQTLE
jgi:hypothetical protein